MNANWQLEVHREYVAGNPRYSFPVRPLGWGKLVGVFLLGFSGLFMWAPGRMAWGAIRQWHQQGPDVGNVIFGLFPLLFVFAGALPLAIGLGILFGRCRLEWRDGQLIATERLGPFWWTRRLPRKPIRKLQVALATSKSSGAAPQPIEKFSGMAVEYTDGTKKVVLLGYPRAWVLACAQELTRYVGGVGSGIDPVTVEEVETSPARTTDADVLEQPAGSRVQVEQNPGRLCYTIPPAGLWRGSSGLFFFGILWCGFMVVFTTLVLKTGVRTPSWGWVGLGAFLLLFWLIGIGILAAALNMGKRTASFTVVGKQLNLVTKGPFGTKAWEWPQSQIAAIRADASGMEVNDRPVLELQIHPHAGKKVGLLAGREENELRWLATQLRHALQVAARTDVK